MKKNTLSRIALLSCLVLLFACKTKKDAAPPVTTKPAPVSSKAASVNAINENEFRFKTLSAKGKIDFKFNNSSNGASLNLRIRNKEIIWLSITAIAGIEVARAMITPDSIKVINRLQGEYFSKPFSFVNQFSNKTVDFATLQNLLTGNPVQGSVSETSEINVRGAETVVETTGEGIIYKLIFNKGFKLTENNLSDSKGQQLRASYSDFHASAGSGLPYSVSILSSSGNKKIHLDLKYSSVSVNEQVDFPFSVPKRFTVKD